MKVRVALLTDLQLERLLILLTGYRMDVVADTVTGFGQSKEQELRDVDALIRELDRVQGP